MTGRRRREQQEDDGRTIADMSGLERPSLYHPPGVSEGWNSGEKKAKGQSRESEGGERPWEDSSLTPRERRMYALGALKAALLIGLAYLAGLGVVIWLLLKLWT